MTEKIISLFLSFWNGLVLVTMWNPWKLMEREIARSSIRIWLFSHSVHTSITPLILQCLKYFSLLCEGYPKLRYINLDKRHSVFRSVFFSLCDPQAFKVFNHFYVLTTLQNSLLASNTSFIASNFSLNA